ncbi:hypothetical protein [Pseudosulfitobacter sp. SM2401]|uniref:hypothetical protein n=1 Tax=Pseudosulfitobacter sp. SM2401 TaxID=3350098 RepID=UPI0036F1A58E
MKNPPPIRDFSAWVNLQRPGPFKIIVTGEVETKSSADLPHLSPNAAPRTSSSTLELDLSIRNTGGIGTQAFQYHDARFEGPANSGQYTKVLILWQGDILCELDVSEAH